MNSGNSPYWIAIACAQPHGIPTGCRHALRPKRIDASSSVHHNMVSITATAPARNSGRCGAAASRRGNPAGNSLACVLSTITAIHAQTADMMLPESMLVTDTGQSGGFDQREEVAATGRATHNCLQSLDHDLALRRRYRQ